MSCGEHAAPQEALQLKRQKLELHAGGEGQQRPARALRMNADRSAGEMAREQDVAQLLEGDAHAPAEVVIEERNKRSRRWLGGSSLGRSLGGRSLGRSLGGRSLGRSLGGSSLGRSLGGSCLGRSLGGSSLGRNFGGSCLGRSLGGSCLGCNLGGSSLGRSLATGHDAVGLGARLTHENQSAFYFQASAQRFPVLRLLRGAECANTSPGGVACRPTRVVVRGAVGRAAERPDTMHVIPRYIGLLAGDSPVNACRFGAALAERPA